MNPLLMTFSLCAALSPVRNEYLKQYGLPMTLSIEGFAKRTVMLGTVLYGLTFFAFEMPRALGLPCIG